MWRVARDEQQYASHADCHQYGYNIGGTLFMELIQIAVLLSALLCSLVAGLVFTFAIVTLGVLSDDIDLERADDKTYR